ncbi:MAG: hypothetical protein OXF44_07135 [Anaerolineaceae bacterium]|nr:hypothetical protein [Anaerolineaceae bacterium]
MHSRLLSLLSLLLLLSALPLTAQETLVVTGEGSAPAFACAEADCERLAWLPACASISILGEVAGRELEGSALWYEVLLNCPCFDFERHSLHDVPDTKDPEKNVWREWHPYWSPQGERIATVFGNSLYVWDAASGERQVQALLDILHSGHMAWSPDGSRIVVGGGIYFDDERQVKVEPERNLLLVNADGTSPMPLPVQAGGVRDVAWSHDGTRIAAVGDELQIRDAQSGKELLTFEEPATRVAWSSDDRRIAITGLVGQYARALRLLDANSGSRLLSLNVAEGEHFGDMAWAPGGTRIAYTTYSVVEQTNDHGLVTGSVVYIWDTDEQDSPVQLIETDDWLFDLDWSPDGRFLVTSLRGAINVMDVRDGRTVAVLVPTFLRVSPEREIGRFFAELVDWSPDGMRIAASGINTGERMSAFRTAGLVWDLTLIPEGPTRAFIHSSQLGGA